MGLLNRNKQSVKVQEEEEDVFDFPLLPEKPSSGLLLDLDDEPALTPDDYVSPVEETTLVAPLGVERIRVGVTVKISRSYNTFEAHFSAEGDPGLSSAEEIRCWVREQCYDQLSRVLVDLGEYSAKK